LIRVRSEVRVVVLASGAGTTLQALLDDAQLRPLIRAVGSDRHGAAALERARAAGVPTFLVPLTVYADRESWNRALEKAVAEYEPDLLVLAGFMRVLDAAFVRRFRIVNTHPALLPHFRGAHPVRDALAAGVQTTGVTVHWVDEGVDSGPVIAQVEVPVRPDDDEDSLRARIQLAEKPLFVRTIRALCAEETLRR
jgi:formyltetrahydrofolate-dependent phosphoribosylglycinamide formyltransferase